MTPEEEIAWTRLEMERSSIRTPGSNKLCCELNAGVYCKGCDQKWCGACGAQSDCWADSSFDHYCLSAVAGIYKCPVAGKVKNTFKGTTEDALPAVLVPLI